MADQDSIAAEFEEQRAHLRGVAYRILGSVSDADDAVQDAWLRLSRTDISDVVNLRGWLTTVVARVALNMLRARSSRREDVSAEPPEPQGAAHAPRSGPQEEALLGDSVGAALQVVLDTLEPRERLAFVLHDLFGVPFDEIAPVVGASPAAARQLASRARRRVQASPGSSPDYSARQARHHEIVTAFFAAAREARFADLLELLDPDVAMRADAVIVRMGGEAEAAGADAVARWICGRALAAEVGMIDGVPSGVWRHGGKVRGAFWVTVADGRITRIEMIADPHVLDGLDIDDWDIDGRDIEVADRDG